MYKYFNLAKNYFQSENNPDFTKRGFLLDKLFNDWQMRYLKNI